MAHTGDQTLPTLADGSFISVDSLVPRQSMGFSTLSLRCLGR